MQIFDNVCPQCKHPTFTIRGVDSGGERVSLQCVKCLNLLFFRAMPTADESAYLKVSYVAQIELHIPQEKEAE
jgi:hypothetical protein